VNVPVLWWRSVGHAHSAFVMETLVDELATRAKADPIVYRRKLLKADAKRLRAALDLMDQKSATWRTRLPAGHAAGIACHECFGTTGRLRRGCFHREREAPHPPGGPSRSAWGSPSIPSAWKASSRAGVAFGLTQLMAKGAITLKDGRVEQRNFDGYTPPYIVDAPIAVDVHIVPSGEAPSGSGEPPVPVISPAVVNALTRLTGRRYRKPTARHRVVEFRSKEDPVMTKHVAISPEEAADRLAMRELVEAYAHCADRRMPRARWLSSPRTPTSWCT